MSPTAVKLHGTLAQKAYGFNGGIKTRILDFYRYLAKYPNINQSEVKESITRVKTRAEQEQSKTKKRKPR